VNAAVGILLAALTTTTTPPGKTIEAAPIAAERTPIYLHVDAPDAVGAAYVARLRHALQGSSAYRAATHPSDARFVVGIVTMDPSEGGTGAVAGNSTVAAVTLQRESETGLNQYVYSWVLVATRDKVDAVVADVLAAIDREIRVLDEPASQRTGLLGGF
jgi:hypothetical protein